jgi:phosphotransferase system enzyme I (PtsI)
MSGGEGRLGDRGLHGIPASPGIAIGKLQVLERDDLKIPEKTLEQAEVKEEIERFRQAVASAREDISLTRTTLALELGEEQAKIFDAHLMILDDETVVEKTVKDIAAEKRNAEFLFSRNVAAMVDSFERINDTYLRDRAADVRDVRRRVLRVLMRGVRPSLTDQRDPVVIVAHDLSPSDTAVMDKNIVLGFATDLGGGTSHSAVMARSRGIPAVVGLKTVTQSARTGDQAVIDGNEGIVEINPDEKRLRYYEKRKSQFEDFERGMDQLRDLPAETLDGRSIDLSANIEMPEEVEQAKERGACGVGLFRTEFFYMRRGRLPSEEEQFEAYRQVAEATAPEAVIIRTLDVGGDKFAAYLGTARETNPFLGRRGIRFSLEKQDIFKCQIRAIFRASAFGNIKVMFPMVSSLDELRAANAVCDEVQSELRKEGISYDERMEVGIMVETPSAVLISDALAREADFFSVGSNDLIQYTLAVDRGNVLLAHLYEPFHPGVLRLLKRAVDVAHDNKIWIGLCGEMAGDPLGAVLLVGLGFDELSTSVYRVPEIKTVIRSVTYSDARDIMDECMRLSTASEVKSLLMRKLKRKLPKPVLSFGGRQSR